MFFCPNSLVEFTRKQVNVVAYELAKTAMYMPNAQVFELMSNCIIDVIYNDMRKVCFLKK
jgi:hypothetical protein